MLPLLTRVLLIAATLATAILAGGYIDRAFVGLPAWRQPWTRGLGRLQPACRSWQRSCPLSFRGHRRRLAHSRGIDQFFTLTGTNHRRPLCRSKPHPMPSMHGPPKLRPEGWRVALVALAQDRNWHRADFRPALPASGSSRGLSRPVRFKQLDRAGKHTRARSGGGIY